MPDILLTPHQQEAVTWVLDHLLADAPLIALRGLAGTGKTSMIPHIRVALMAKDISVAIGAPTHRAAMILRRKGITSADTVHAHALTPYFTAEYARAIDWLGGEVNCRQLLDLAHDDVETIPWLIYEHVKPDLKKAHTLRRYGARYPAKRRLASIGIHGRDYFDGFGPKHNSGVLIIDEASMVGATMLALCQEAFPQLLLVGDPGQLPPVSDEAILEDIEGVDLLEIHRQAAESPIIQLAYQAREGKPFWQEHTP